jgi:hypothetical protein
MKIQGGIKGGQTQPLCYGIGLTLWKEEAHSGWSSSENHGQSNRSSRGKTQLEESYTEQKWPGPGLPAMLSLWLGPHVLGSHIEADPKEATSEVVSWLHSSQQVLSWSIAIGSYTESNRVSENTDSFQLTTVQLTTFQLQEINTNIL